MIKLENVNKYFNKRKRNEIHIINNTSLELGSNGLVAILGQSGSGKTTLLNVIGGLDKVGSGNIYINGKKLTKKSSYTVDKIRNLNVGYIFQDYKLVENLSVFENIAISLRMIGIKNKKEIEKRVNYILERVSMYRYRNRPAKMLSGGEKQRVAIARALVKNPNIVIADEPTGNLDSKNSLEIMNIIKTISKDKLVILVTHEVDLAKFYASKILEIKDGKIVKDYKNEIKDSLDYRLDNKIYLKDFKNIQNVQNDNVNLDIYSDDNEKINIKLVIKNGNIFIESQNKKIEVINSDSSVELVDDHYKKIDKSFYQKYDFNINSIIDNTHKPKYSSIYGLGKSIVNGFKKISNYTLLKKILFAGFFASSLFIMYAVANISGTLEIKDSDFISKNKNYLQVDMTKVSVDDFLKYENLDDIDYILPGDSSVNFKIKFDDYYQISKYTVNLSGSLVTSEAIDNEKLIKGRKPQNDYEIVVDKMIIDDIINDSFSVSRFLGIKNDDELLNKKVYLDNMNPFTIVGIVDQMSPSIYTNKTMFINILNNTSKSDDFYSDYAISNIYPTNESSEDTVMDYNLYLDDITLKEGKFPTEDYEVIVNISNKYQMELNKSINVNVNNNNLKVVGYYDSKTNMHNYLVSPNTVKYSIINKNTGLAIYPKNKNNVLEKFKNEYNLNIVDTYEKDREKYLEEKKDSVISSIIFAGIILAISLIEIYLMIRSSFLSRIKEIGVFRAIGVKKWDIYRMFLGEILAISTVTGLPGIALMAYILNAITNIPYIGSTFIVNVGTICLSILIVYLFNIIVGLMPLYKVLRKTPSAILSRHDVE